MHLVSDGPSPLVESIDQLVEYVRAASKPRAAWKIGTEYEMAGVVARGPAAGRAPAYEGEAGIGAVFAGFAARGFTPVLEDGHVIALTGGGGQVTFEPGGQLEHAMRPMASALELEAEVAKNTERLAAIARPLGLAWLSQGIRPFGTRDDVPWMPKQRYAIMRRYLPTRGVLAHEMMLRTCTVQVNLDYADEDDARDKMRCVQHVTPLLTALWANSPIVDGRPTGYQSYRARAWLDTDRDRCGLLDFLEGDGPVFRGYAEWALDVPLFFVHRGHYREAGGTTFRQFWQQGWEGERATLDDWALHLSTLFPEIRLKTYLEIRGCDVGSIPMMLALAPLAKGLLHDVDARRAATALTAGLDWGARRSLTAAVPRTGLQTKVGKTTVGELARELVAIADAGLAREAPEERRFLEPVHAIAASGRTQADAALDAWNAAGGDPERVIAALSYPGLDGR